MKITAMPSVVNSMSLANPKPALQEVPSTNQAHELPISDTNETKVEPEATQPLSPQFAELAKRRRALQLKERALAEKEKALAEMDTGSDRIEIARLKSEPLRVLQEAGVTYDQLTEHLLASQGDAKVMALESKIEALQKGVDQKFLEKETQAEKQVLAEMRMEATKLASKDNSFELVRETRSIPEVMQLIERTYRESGEVLDVSEAMQMVEDYLFKETQRLAGLEKIKSQFAKQAPPPQQKPGMRTLKNSDTATMILSRKARALAAWNNFNK